MSSRTIKEFAQGVNLDKKQLQNTIKQNGTLQNSISEAFNRLTKYKKVSKNMIVFLRATEVTRNEIMDTYHPHIHVLLFVSPTYFKGDGEN